MDELKPSCRSYRHQQLARRPSSPLLAVVEMQHQQPSSRKPKIEKS